MANKTDNAASYFVDRHRSTDYADKPAFIEADGGKKRLSYTDLAIQTGRMADLYERHNIVREERAAMLVLDTIEFPIIFWGSLKSGVIPVPLNTLLGSDVYKQILIDCRATILFVSEGLLPSVQGVFAQCDALRKIVVIGEKSTDHLCFSDELALCAERDAIAVTDDENAFWLYSSGSTGQPKGVRHVHGSLRCTVDTYGSQVLGISHQDVVYSVAKCFFAYGLGNALSFPMSVGATTILLSGRPTPDSVIDVINSMAPTIFCAVPTLYAATVAHIESGKGSINTPLRRCISAGEALPEQIGLGWEAITGCEILDGVGSTEMLHIFLSNQPGDVVYGTSGVAVPGYSIRLVNDQGIECGVGEIGELLVNGNSAASDYWNKRDKSRATFEGVWTHTGDKYEKRDDGRLIYCGRTDDMFKVSGIWVSPFEIEQALVSHEKVLEAAIVPATDDQSLEKPKAFIVLKDQQHTSADDSMADELKNELKEHVKQQIGKWKYPRWIEIVSELPKTATGKIQRFKLRD